MAACCSSPVSAAIPAAYDRLASDHGALSVVMYLENVMHRSFVIQHVSCALVTATPLRSMSAWNTAANDASHAPAWDNFAIPF